MRLGTVTLFGSGETSPTGGRVFEALARQVGGPPQIAILETPAGFEVNAGRVAGRVAEFLAVRLQNTHPRVTQVPARAKGTPLSPDSPDVVAPLYESNLIFLGPGSPTYTVRQLQDSLAWHLLQARHRLGAQLVFASAAAIAAGALALPVYEIYKVGEDLHWTPGLDFFASFGLTLAIIPHWNNQDGGSDLDTTRCFMGQARFERLMALLPPGVCVLGIDEQTSVTIDLAAGECAAAGLGCVHILRGGQMQDVPAGSRFLLQALGAFQPLSDPGFGLPARVWQQAAQLAERIPPQETAFPAPPEVRQMIEERQAARSARDWARADVLRRQIAALGWAVVDTPDGPQLRPL